MSSYRPYQNIERRKSRKIHVGRVPVGGDSPITVQTNAPRPAGMKISVPLPTCGVTAAMSAP